MCRLFVTDQTEAGVSLGLESSGLAGLAADAHG